MIMPGLNGKDTFAALKRVNPQIKAILLSGFSLNELAQETLQSGVMEFLGKPCDQGDFSQAVARVLAR